MRFSLRIFLVYFVLLAVAGWFIMQNFSRELLPGMRQSLEETLVDTAHLLAEIIAEQTEPGQALVAERFSNAVQAYGQRSFRAEIWSLSKQSPNLSVYVTDTAGRVLYDSKGRDEGKDFSRWNDVYLTLRGKYGARTTRADPDDVFSSIMHVAAPIMRDDRIVGVVSVGKPSSAVRPFLQQALDNIREKAFWLLLAAVLLGATLSHWLTLSIRRLTAYADAVRNGRRAEPPRLNEPELDELAKAMDAMRRELEGKDYVESYLHGLTHELKSPLAAIRGAAELLEENPPEPRRQRFIANIRNESRRLDQIVERLLHLAAYEKRQGLEQVETLDLPTLLRELIDERRIRAEGRQLSLAIDAPDALPIQAERFALRSAIGNLLDNALDFSPTNGSLDISLVATGGSCQLRIRDQGPGIPGYAQDKLFQRFYSLPRPNDGPKSTGLGLSLVHEIAQLHGGEIRVENHPDGGAVAELTLPIQTLT